MGAEPESKSNQNGSITSLLALIRQGDRQAQTKLIDQIYTELRGVASRYIRRERPNHTLQPTALVNEAYMKLLEQPNMEWKDRAHFLAFVARVMRHILVDYARAKKNQKRGGFWRQVTLTDAQGRPDRKTVDTLALDEALERLAMIDPRQARVVEMHFFAGLSFEEIAHVLDVSERTAKRDWAMARGWLHGELSKGNDPL